MLQVSSKCYYALRALYDLALHADRPTVKTAEIAARRKIPARFLEAILGQLKQGGFVESRRGADGGYRLARPAEQIVIGDVMRFIDGPLAPVDCVSLSQPKPCAFEGDCGFFSLWERARAALSAVLDGTTLAALIAENRQRESKMAANWSI